MEEKPVSGKLRWLLPLAIAIVTFAVYIPSLGFDFVYDDYAQIVETKQLNSWHMIPRYFTGHVWAWKTPGLPGPYYRPVFLLWLLMNQMLFGLSASFWHLTSILTHVAATLLVYALGKKLTGDRYVGAIAALLFGLHPAHLESVDWVSGITDPLLAVFVLGSLLCFLRGERKWATISLGLYALALLEKETAVILPLLVFAYAWLWKRKLVQAFSAALPYFLLTLIYLGIRLKVLHELSMLITPVSLHDMVLTWPSMLSFYFLHLAWPVGLTVLYGFQLVHSPDLRHFIVPCMIIAAVLLGLAAWSMRSRVAAFCALLLVVPLLPAMNLRAFARVELVHDRYLYLSSVGFCILAALALRRIRVPAQIAVVALIACAFGYGLVDQGQYWSDNLTLFTRAVTISPENEIANQGMGTSLLLRGSIAEAVPYYKHALERNPDMFESSYSLGRCYYELGMYPESEPYFERAIAGKPTDTKAYLYYGMAKLKEGRIAVAERVLRYAMRIKGPDDYREYHLALGMVLKQKGDLAGALGEFQAEARENPDPSKALEQIAEIRSGQPNETRP